MNSSETLLQSIRFRQTLVPIVVIVCTVGVLVGSMMGPVTLSQAVYCALGNMAALLLYGAFITKGFMRLLFIACVLISGVAPRLAAHTAKLVDMTPVQTACLILLFLPIAVYTRRVAVDEVPPPGQRNGKWLAVIFLMAFVWMLQAVLIPVSLGEPLVDRRIGAVEIPDGMIAVSDSGQSRIVYSISDNASVIKLSEVSSGEAFLAPYAHPILTAALSDREAVVVTEERQREGAITLAFTQWNADGQDSLGTLTRDASVVPAGNVDILSLRNRAIALNNGVLVKLEALEPRDEQPNKLLAGTNFVGWSGDEDRCVYYNDESNEIALLDESTGASNPWPLKYSPTAPTSIGISTDGQHICYVIGVHDAIVFERLSDGKVGIFKLSPSLRVRPYALLRWIDGSSIVYISRRGVLGRITMDMEKMSGRFERLSQVFDVVVGVDYAPEERAVYWTTVAASETALHRLEL